MEREAFAPYRDRHGLIQNSRDLNGGNGLRHTAEYFIGLHLEGQMTVADKAEWERVVRSCEVVVDGKAVPGLYARSPVHPDQQGPDDLHFVATCSYLVGSPFADDLFAYGQKRIAGMKYVYNNVMPGTIWHRDGRLNTSAMMWRQFGMIAHFYHCREEQAPPFYSYCWRWNLNRCLKKPKSDQDAWALSWACAVAASPATRACRETANEWWKAFNQTWPGGYRQLLREYFADKNHPLGIHFPA